MKRASVSGKQHLCALLAVALMMIVVAAGCSRNSSGPRLKTTMTVVAVSDVHFTPFYDTSIFDDLVASPVEEWPGIFEGSSVTEPSTWGEETNYPLLKLALNAASRNIAEAHMVIFPGDMLCHHFPETFYDLYGEEDPEAMRSFAHKTVIFFANQVRERFVSLPVVFTLGNNDSYAGDYRLVPGGAFLADTADPLYRTFLLGTDPSDDFFDTYPVGGYFTMEVPGTDVLFVSLNSVLFSTHRTVTCTDEPDNVPSLQLDWLEQILAKAAAHQRKVFILTHIPPGMDIYGTVKAYMDASGKISDAALMWKNLCQIRFLEICRRYAASIEILFSGHTHMDEYQLILESEGLAHKAAVVIPAVSPQFGNNPAFKLFTFAKEDWEPLDYRSVVCHLDEVPNSFGPLYTFDEAYSTTGPLAESLVDLFPKMKVSTHDRDNYARFYYSGHDDADIIDDRTWPAYWCGIGKMNRTEYVECVNSYY